MLCRNALTAVGLFLGASPAAVAEEGFVNVDFPTAKMTAADQQTMDRYRENPVNLRCDFVGFDSEPLLALIADLENGTTTVSSSYITIRFPTGEVLRYNVNNYEGSEQHGKNGPFLWEGKIDDGGKHFASLVIHKSNGTRAYMSTAQGMYRLSPSSQAGNYFLCQRDPGFRRGVARKAPPKKE